MANLSEPSRRRLLIGCLAYAALVIPVAIRRGSDLQTHFAVAELWLGHLPLYHTMPSVGVWWPPFAIVLVAPFAVLAHWSLGLAKASWAVLGVACLWRSLRETLPAGARSGMVALAAVAVPLHRNFEDLNLNPLLLLLLIAAAADLERGREWRTGAWIGTATALKFFPGLLIVYLACRGHWRACGAAIVVTAALTLGAVLPYGLRGGVQTVVDWIATGAQAGWGVRGSNQSLAALATRLHLGATGLGVLDLGCIALAARALARPGLQKTRLDDIGIVALVAVLLSPIAWVHYFLLAYPAWLTVSRHRVGAKGTAWPTVLVLAGVATSGMLTVWSLSLRSVLFEWSLYTWGALALLASLAFAPAAQVDDSAGQAGPTDGVPRLKWS